MESVRIAAAVACLGAIVLPAPLPSRKAVSWRLMEPSSRRGSLSGAARAHELAQRRDKKAGRVSLVGQASDSRGQLRVHVGIGVAHGAPMGRARGARELRARALRASTARDRAMALAWRAERVLEHV